MPTAATTLSASAAAIRCRRRASAALTKSEGRSASTIGAAGNSTACGQATAAACAHIDAADPCPHQTGPSLDAMPSIIATNRIN